MIFNSFFLKIHRFYHLSLLVILLLFTIFCVVFTLLVFNEGFKTLEDYSLIHGTVTDYYSADSTSDKGKNKYNEFFVIVVNNSIRIGLSKSRYKENLDSLTKNISKREEINVYVDGHNRNTYLWDRDCESENHTCYTAYAIRPEQVELVKTKFVFNKDYKKDLPYSLTEEEALIAIQHGDSSVLTYGRAVNNKMVVIAESYDNSENIENGKNVLLLTLIVFTSLIITYFNYRSRTKQGEEEEYKDSGNAPVSSSLFKDILSAVFSIGIFVYSINGLINDDIYIPGKRYSGTHFHGLAAWSMFFCLLGISAILAAGALSRFFQKNNAIKYKIFLKITFMYVLALLLLSVIIKIFAY
jgi:hypothetical protein